MYRNLKHLTDAQTIHVTIVHREYSFWSDAETQIYVTKVLTFLLLLVLLN